MKGKKMVFAVMLSLIVCLLLVPTCAYATEVEPVPENSDLVVLPTVPDGDTSKVPAAPAVIGDLDDDDTVDAPNGGDDGDDKIIPDIDEDEGGEDSTIPGEDDDTEKEPGSDEEGESTIPGDSDDDDDDEDEDEDENNDNKDKPANNSGGSDNVIPSDTTPSGNGGFAFMVEFSYGGKSYKLDDLKGNEQFGLADILKELGIEGNIDDAKGDADDLFVAENGEDGWKVTTKKAFNSKQTMTVVVDGVEYVLDVIDDAKVSTAEALQNALNEGGTIVLMDHIQGNFVIPKDKTVTIKLNGKTLSNNGGYTLTNNGTLIVEGDGTVTATGWDCTALLNTGTATINGGSFSTKGGKSKAWYVVKNLGDMTINGGTFSKDCIDTSVVDSGWASYGPNNCGVDYADKDASLTINGGKFEKGYYSVKNVEHSTLTINNGSFDDAVYAVVNAGETEISGGTYNSTSANIYNYTEITISGGNFTSSGVSSIILNGDKTTTTVTGGTFNANSFLRPVGDNVNTGKGSATISGGSINANLTSKPLGEWTGLDLGVTGGTFTDDSVKELVGEKDVVIEKDGKIYVNTPVLTANTIAPAYDAPAFKYMVVEGKDQTWTKSGSESLNYVLNADANNLVKVLIDGEEVEFEIDENGEVVISAEVLEKLDAGEYEIEFIFADGSCKTKLFVM